MFGAGGDTAMASADAPASVHEPLLDRVARDLDAAREAQLRPDARAVRGDRSLAEVQLNRDLAEAAPERHQPQHLHLADGEQLVGRRREPPARGAGETLG